MFRRSLLPLCFLVLAAGGIPEEAPSQVPFGDVRRGSRIMLVGTAGYSFLTGEIGDSISGGLGAEVAGQYQLREAPLRVGIGGGYASLSFTEVDASADKWSFFGLASLLIYSNESESIPYIQLRVGWTSLSDDREAVKTSRSGLEIGAVVGVDVPISEKISLDVSGLFSWINTGDASVDDVGVAGSSQTGSTFGLRAGAIFFVN